jgi:hypothetical protein
MKDKCAGLRLEGPALDLPDTPATPPNATIHGCIKKDGHAALQK